MRKYPHFFLPAVWDTQLLLPIDPQSGQQCVRRPLATCLCEPFHQQLLGLPSPLSSPQPLMTTASLHPCKIRSVALCRWAGSCASGRCTTGLFPFISVVRNERISLLWWMLRILECVSMHHVFFIHFVSHSPVSGIQHPRFKGEFYLAHYFRGAVE